jgi:hypothetical protein
MSDTCVRCQRPNPDPDGPGEDWEVLISNGEDVGDICPDCIRPDEQEAIDADWMALQDELGGRR